MMQTLATEKTMGGCVRRRLGVRCCVLALLVCAAACAPAASVATNEVSRGLVARMLDARNGSVAPKKPMWRAVEKEALSFAWPFDAARVRTVAGALESAAAANNLAVLLHAREANRTTYMPPYVETLLRRAATGGCEEAYHNLGVLAEERGDKAQAAAFYSREKAK